jgi:hypothetical protein
MGSPHVYSTESMTAPLLPAPAPVSILAPSWSEHNAHALRQRKSIINRPQRSRYSQRIFNT